MSSQISLRGYLRSPLLIFSSDGKNQCGFLHSKVEPSLLATVYC